MNTTTTQQFIVYSKPTKCVKCTLTVEFTHAQDADMKLGGWACPHCTHVYRFTHWKIQKAGKRALKKLGKELN